MSEAPAARPATGSATEPAEAVALAVVASCAALLIGLRQIGSWDFWWHLAIGREALQSRSFVPVDTFSYSFAGAAFRHKDLLGDVAFYSAFETAGFAGIALLRALAVGTLFFALWRLVEKPKRSALVVAIVAGITIAAVQQRLIPRPLMFTIAAFPLMLALIEHVRRKIPDGPAAVARAHIPIIALQWLWLELHRGGILGIILLIGHVGALLLAMGMHLAPRLRAFAGPRATPAVVATFAALAALTTAIGALHPSGIGVYTTALSVTGDPIHRTRISEWAPLTWELARTIHPVTIVLLVAGWATAIASALRSMTRDEPCPVQIWHVGVLALFTIQGVASMRWLSYASGAAAIILVLAGSAWLAKHKFSPPRGATLLAGLLPLALAHALSPTPVGLGPMPNRFPTDALAFAASVGLAGDVHNSFVYGGYLTWDARFDVLIDGRNDMLYPSEFYGQCVDAATDPSVFAALQDAHRTSWVLAENVPGRESFVFLADDPEWVAVYWSDPAIIYVRAEEAAPLIDAGALQPMRALHPFHLQPSLMHAIQSGHAPAYEAELRHWLERNPESVRLWSMQALLAHAAGDTALRDEVMRQLRMQHPEHPAIDQLSALFDAN